MMDAERVWVMGAIKGSSWRSDADGTLCLRDCVRHCLIEGNCGGMIADPVCVLAVGLCFVEDLQVVRLSTRLGNLQSRAIASTLQYEKRERSTTLRCVRSLRCMSNSKKCKP